MPGGPNGDTGDLLPLILDRYINLIFQSLGQLQSLSPLDLKMLSRAWDLVKVKLRHWFCSSTHKLSNKWACSLNFFKDFFLLYLLYYFSKKINLLSIHIFCVKFFCIQLTFPCFLRLIRQNLFCLLSKQDVALYENNF